MGKSQETYGKKEREKKRLKKRKEKALKKEERKANPKAGGFDSMIAYVDEFGNVTDTPPDPTKKVEIEAEDIVLGVPKKEDVEFDPVRKGRVEFFNDAKGFGFIKEKDTGEKHFVHINGCNDEIKENNMVSFELEKGMKGMIAVNVTVIR